MRGRRLHALYLAPAAAGAADVQRACSRWATVMQGAMPDLSWHTGQLEGGASDLAASPVREALVLAVIDAGPLWPGSTGWPPCGRQMPVLVRTSAACSEQAQAWLNAGADMVVPDSTTARELEARVRALLRPMGMPSQPDGICLDLSPPRLRWRNGRQLALAPREAQLLQVLTRREGRPGTKMELLLDLGWRQEGRTPPFLELVVSRLRARLRAELGDDAAQALETRRGAGYAWRRDCLPRLL